MLEKIMELLNNGKDIEEIADELSLPKEEVLGALRILESMGYLEKVTLGDDKCSSCPLKGVCPGSCFRFKGQVYTFKLERF